MKPSPAQMEKVMKHPIDKDLERMNKKDREIAEEMMEEEFSDEDLYAALSPALPDYLTKGEPK